MIIARSLSRLLPLTLVAVLAPLGLTRAAASPPTSASGTVALTSCDFTSQQTAGTNTIFTGICRVTWTGTFAGTDAAQATVTFHADGSADGNAVDTFTGTATLRNLIHGDPSGNSSGEITVIGGTGGLANLHGSVKLSGNAASMTYSGRIQFAGS
jgi:hypothetical protein